MRSHNRLIQSEENEDVEAPPPKETKMVHLKMMLKKAEEEVKEEKPKGQTMASAQWSEFKRKLNTPAANSNPNSSNASPCSSARKTKS